MNTQAEFVTPDWAAQWTARTLPALQWESIAVFCLTSLAALWTYGGAIREQIRARRAIAANPDAHAATVSSLDERMKSATDQILRLAALFMMHSSMVWLVDIALSFAEDDFAVFRFHGPTGSTAGEDVLLQKFVFVFIALFGISLALCLGVMLLIATMILIPMLQMALVAKLMTCFARKPSNGPATFATYLPEARLMATHNAYIWQMITFLTFAFAQAPHPVDRVAHNLWVHVAFGSGYAWFVLARTLHNDTQVAGLAAIPLQWPAVRPVLASMCPPRFRARVCPAAVDVEKLPLQAQGAHEVLGEKA